MNATVQEKTITLEDLLKKIKKGVRINQMYKAEEEARSLSPEDYGKAVLAITHRSKYLVWKSNTKAPLNLL